MSSHNRTLFVALFFVAVLAFASAAAWRLHAMNRDRAVALFQDQQFHSSQVIAATLSADVKGLSRSVRLLAMDAADNGRSPEFGHRLSEQLQCPQPPCFAAFAAFDASGALAQSAGRTIGLAPDVVRASLQWSVNPHRGPELRTLISSSSTPALILVAPVEKGGLFAGEIDLDSLFYSQTQVAEPSLGRTVLVIDGFGNVVFHSQHPEMRLNNVRARTVRCFNCHQTFDYVDKMLLQQRGVVDYSLHGVPQLAAFSPLTVEGQPWVAAVMGPTENAIGIVSAEGRQLAVIMMTTVLALGLTVRVTWKAGRRRLEAQAEAERQAHLKRSNSELTALNSRLESAAVEWRSTVDTIDAALVVLDPSGRIERMNRAAADMLPGAPFTWLNEPSERLKEYPPWDSALALARDAVNRDTISTARVRYDDTGQTWDLWCRAPQRHDRHGTVVIVARDVTAVVELQESLRRSETMAALGSLLGGVAHEVRNPLFAISSLVDAWSLRYSAETAPFKDALQREVQRLNSLMTELLEYGTPAKADPQPHRLAPVIKEAVRSCQPEAALRHVRIVAEAPADIDVWVDPNRFVRVLINVIQNAIQHSPEESEVEVTVVVSRRKPTVLEIAVRDHGLGFREEDLPRVFTPFFSRRRGGFGLGLAICERIASEHRSTILAANHPEGGAVVSISLPIVAASPEASFCEGAQVC